MPDLNNLQKNVQKVLDSTRAFIDKASDLPWSPADGSLPIIRRAILRRQFDSLEVISNLAAEQKGYAAGPLLRPACEELIWAKYMSDIGDVAAGELMTCLAQREMLDSLRAQDKYGGRESSISLGLLPALNDARSNKQQLEKKLNRLGKELGWPSHTIDNKDLPSMAWLAKKTGEMKVYEYVYHATSRFVHFSTLELHRRAWGDETKMSIRSVHFTDYWGSFALYWGVYLFLGAVVALCDAPGMPEDGTNMEDLQSASKSIGEFGKVPIITAEELKWPE